MKAYWGRGSKDHAVFDLDIRWRRMVCFTLWLLYPPEKEPLVPIG